jgi:hypothetical protein
MALAVLQAGETVSGNPVDAHSNPGNQHLGGTFRPIGGLGGQKQREDRTGEIQQAASLKVPAPRVPPPPHPHPTTSAWGSRGSTVPKVPRRGYAGTRPLPSSYQPPLTFNPFRPCVPLPPGLSPHPALSRIQSGPALGFNLPRRRGARGPSDRETRF